MGGRGKEIKAGHFILPNGMSVGEAYVHSFGIISIHKLLHGQRCSEDQTPCTVVLLSKYKVEKCMYPGQHKTIISSAMCTVFFVQSEQCTPWVLHWSHGQISDLQFNMPRQNSFHRTSIPYTHKLGKWKRRKRKAETES